MSITPELSQSRFLRAVRGEPVDAPPVWIMRQAGRYMPEYMAVRSRVTFMELCKRPELAAEVTLIAQQVLGVDAAILFADLLPILEPMGLHLEYQQGEGPVIHNPLRIPARLTASARFPIHGTRICLRGGEADPSPTACEHPAAGICRMSVHSRQLCDRGSGLQELLPHQADDVCPARPSGSC